MKKDAFVFIEHILENIKDIEKFSKGLTREKLEKSRLKQKAIVRSLEIIGEAVKNLPGKFREKYSDVPWKGIAGIRDKLIHHYFGVDLDEVWNIIEYDLPKLKKQIEEILGELKENNKKTEKSFIRIK